MGKRILFLAGRLPYPIDDGWKIRTFNLIKGLSRHGYVIDLLTFIKTEKEKNFFVNLKDYCNIYCIVRDKEYAITDLIKGVCTSTPLPVLNYRISNMHKKISELIAENKYDLIQVEDIVMCQYLPKAINTLKVLDMHNIESELMRRYAKEEKNIFKKIYAVLTARKLEAYENFVKKEFDLILVCSEDDRNILLRRGGFEKVELIPNGVDCSYYDIKNEEAIPNNIVFVGSMDYHANITGMKYFLKKIFPAVIKRHEDVKLYIVGKNPSKDILHFTNKNITVTGAVEDVRPYLSSAKVVIVPLLVGGGTRLKILEAMAMGKAIVSTSVGSEGISVKDGHNIIIADTVDQFTQGISLLLENDALLTQIGDNAKEFSRLHYDWKIITTKLHDLYVNMCMP